VSGEPEIVTLGECLVALVASDPGPLAEARTFRHFVAGAEANVAVGLARLGHRACFVGRVGSDGFGEAIIRRLRGEGVDVRALLHDPAAPTGLLVRNSGGSGALEVLYYRGGSAGSRLTVEDVERAWDGLAGARWLHLTGITPALSGSAREAVERSIELAKSADMTVSLDVNMRRKLWTEAAAAPVLAGLAGRVDVVLGGPDELAVLSRSAADEASEIARAVLGLGATTVVVKLGGKGALALTAGGQEVSRPAFPVPNVVDPVGAGDAFAAGWISARLRGAGLPAALDAAAACGASVVAALGDMTGLPTRPELERLLDGSTSDVTR